MCIIVAKNKGVELPDRDTLKTCFQNNPDGVGLMYVDKNKVVIHKGFMTYTDLDKKISKLEHKFGKGLKEKALVVHFRIGTSGKNDRATCHPFPITSNSNYLRATKFKTDLGLVHNGIIRDYTKYDSILSDTQLFVKDYVSVLKDLNRYFYKNDKVLKLIEKESNDTKFALLDTNEQITTIGHFINENGVLYSNSNYKPYTYSSLGCYGGGWSWEDYEPTEYNYLSNRVENKTSKEIIASVKLENKDKSEVVKKSDYKKIPIGYWVSTFNEWYKIENDKYCIDKYGYLYEIIKEYETLVKVKVIDTDTEVYTEEYIPITYSELEEWK